MQPSGWIRRVGTQFVIQARGFARHDELRAGRWTLPRSAPSTQAKWRQAAAPRSGPTCRGDVAGRPADAISEGVGVRAEYHARIGEVHDGGELAGRNPMRHRLGSCSDLPGGHDRDEPLDRVGESDGDHVAVLHPVFEQLAGERRPRLLRVSSGHPVLAARMAVREGSAAARSANRRENETTAMAERPSPPPAAPGGGPSPRAISRPRWRSVPRYAPCRQLRACPPA